MPENNIKVLIADDIKESCEIINRYLDDLPNVEVCCMVNDGQAALDKIHEHKPDIVLLDLIMPRIDGIGVLKKLKEMDSDNRPRVIMLTSVNKESIKNEVFKLGASYCLLKPTSKQTLVQAINMIEKENGADYINNDWSNNIRRFLLNVGVPTNLLGYKYIFYAINLVVNKKARISSQIYSEVANEYNTNAECVEAAIRKSIEKTTKIASPGFIRVFANGENDIIKKPSNLKFISKSVESIYLIRN